MTQTTVVGLAQYHTGLAVPGRITPPLSRPPKSHTRENHLSYTGVIASREPLYGAWRAHIKLVNLQKYFFVPLDSHKGHFLGTSHLLTFFPTFCDCNTARQKKCP